MNIILDLNGFLCVTEDWKSNGRGNVYNPLSELHSPAIGAKVGPKAVTVRPNCSAFLRELGKIAFVSVWSSKKRFIEKFIESLCVALRKPNFNYFILKQFSASRSLDGTLCLLVLGSSMSVHNVI